MMLNDDLLRFEFKVLHPSAKAPTKKPGDIGWDLSCCGSDFIEPKERVVFNTGISIALPDGYHAILKPRSGLAVKHGIDVLAGVIDNSYRGEILVCLQNNGDQTVVIDDGDRIAQMIIVRENEGFFVKVDELSDTDRGSNRFGSSGK